MEKTSENNNSPLSYRLLLLFFSPVVLFITLKKAYLGGGLKYLQQRFSFSIPVTHTSANLKHQPVWFHGASVGEINALLPLIKAYLQKHPSQKLWVTCNTPTAYSILQKQINKNIQISYLPLDYLSITKRFINKLKPKQLIVMETELWPNLYSQCTLAGCNIIIVNGRLSDKTLNTNKILQNAYHFCMKQVFYIFARTEQDQHGFEQLGIKPSKIKTLGNIKYQTPVLKNTVNLIPRPFILLASSHDDEELQIASMWQNHPLAKTHCLLIAPRHPERMQAIAKQLKNLGLSFAIRSKQQTIADSTQIYLADTIGEMANWYQHTDLVIMAGSFIAHGGQNFIEPASYGKAIITGPHTNNFLQDIEYFLQNNAILQVETVEQLSQQLGLFSSTPCLFDDMANNAKSLLNDTIVGDYLHAIESI